MTERFRVDMSDLNGHDYQAIEELTGKPISEVLNRTAGIYGAIWRIKLRTDPTFTYDQALELSLLRDVELIEAGDDAGEPPAAGNGAALPASPVSGG